MRQRDDAPRYPSLAVSDALIALFTTTHAESRGSARQPVAMRPRRCGSRTRRRAERENVARRGRARTAAPRARPPAGARVVVVVRRNPRAAAAASRELRRAAALRAAHAAYASASGCCGTGTSSTTAARVRRLDGIGGFSCAPAATTRCAERAQRLLVGRGLKAIAARWGFAHSAFLHKSAANARADVARGARARQARQRRGCAHREAGGEPPRRRAPLRHHQPARRRPPRGRGARSSRARRRARAFLLVGDLNTLTPADRALRRGGGRKRPAVIRSGGAAKPRSASVSRGERRRRRLRARGARRRRARAPSRRGRRGRVSALRADGDQRRRARRARASTTPPPRRRVARGAAAARDGPQRYAITNTRRPRRGACRPHLLRPGVASASRAARVGDLAAPPVRCALRAWLADLEGIAG